jgi:YD repeat-containing protein
VARDRPSVVGELRRVTAIGTLLTRVLADTTSTSVPYSTNGQTRTWTMTYTSSGQLSTLQLPRVDVTAKTTFTYTGGVLTNIKDALNHNTNIATYKAGGLPLTVYDPNHTLTTLAYSPRLWLTSAVMTASAGSLTTSFQYDSAGNLTKSTLPDNSTLSNTWNDARQITKITNALNEHADFTYDSAGDLTQTQWKTSSNTTKHRHSATFDALGRMLTDKGGVTGQTTTFGYDSNGNVTSIKSPLNKTTTRTFDALNRLKTSTNPVKDLAQISYDSHNRPLTVTDGKSTGRQYPRLTIRGRVLGALARGHVTGRVPRLSLRFRPTGSPRRRSPQRLGDGEAEGLGGLEVEGQLDFYSLLNREFAWFFAFADAACIDASFGGTYSPGCCHRAPLRPPARAYSRNV